ncbi:MAG: Nif3-like dinuclear metal center hexameric protein [Defluviitaleaceae bacterium]|nr:Nif3-like dinuclear metal center hexameric protein [Defluviitaleaceae bacterium]
MSVKMQDIITALENLAPLHIAEDWDNVGLILGRRQTDVSKVLLALDATDEIVGEAIKLGCEAIITHHPPIFKPITRINDDNARGIRFLTLIERGMAVYACHTNLDSCIGGINDMLFDILELANKEYICESKPDVFAARAGLLTKGMTLEGFANFVKKRLNLPFASFVGDADAKVHKVGILGGAGSDIKFFRGALKAGCDTFVTADIRYIPALQAQDLGLNLVEATHYGSEIIFADGIKKYLGQHLPNLEVFVSNVNGQPFKGV